MADRYCEEAEKGFDLGQAINEANRCLLCYDAPCSKGCPAGTDPGTFIRKLRLRNITGALRTVKQNNILGGACGILCPTSELCEKECSATGIDRPIQIGKIQRFLVEHGYETGFDVFSKPEKKPQKIAIVGSGPAGISCAAELAKQGFGVTIFEQFPEPGGVLRYGVPAHRFPRDLLNREIGDLKELGIEIRCSSPIKGRGEVQNLLEEGYSAVFIAPGLWDAVRLKEGIKPVGGVFSSVDFLKALSEKIADLAKHISGKRVAVIGGGSVAIDCAESALRLQARDVYLIYRRSYNEMPSQDDEKTSALKEGVHFLILTRPVDYVADESGALKQIKLIRTELREPDNSGRRRPVDVPGSEWLMDIDAVIEAIGQKAEADSPSWYPSVKLNEGNLIAIDRETGETSVRSVFAGGDIIRGPALIVEAVWDGKVAARTILERLKKEVLV
jgi:glutamate synthase (NADPH) small chain